MAHQNLQLRFEPLQVPMAVVLRSRPCVWEILKSNKLIRFGTTIRRILEESGVHRLARDRFFARWDSPADIYLDPWHVRDDFFGLQTEDDFVRFLGQVGIFSPVHQADYEGAWELKDFRGWQQVFREFLRRSPANWSEYLDKLKKEKPGFNARLICFVLKDAHSFTLQFRWEQGLQSVVLETRDVVTAIFATIHVDRLRGAKFGFCARRDCRKPFEITSKHQRQYCQQYCAHLESLRRMRERQKDSR